MKPSNNLFALVRAYDLTTPAVETLAEFREQSQQFLNDINQYVDAISPLFKQCRGDCREQYHFDAMLSIACDMGTDLFFATRLPRMIEEGASNAQMKKTILGTPCFCCTMRPELAEYMIRYKLGTPSRRELEYKLYCGQPHFTIGRTKVGDSIVYAPSVLHPVYTFLTALSNAR